MGSCPKEDPQGARAVNRQSPLGIRSEVRRMDLNALMRQPQQPRAGWVNPESTRSTATQRGRAQSRPALPTQRAKNPGESSNKLRGRVSYLVNVMPFAVSSRHGINRFPAPRPRAD